MSAGPTGPAFSLGSTGPSTSGPGPAGTTIPLSQPPLSRSPSAPSTTPR
jgi:hypothetical protein